MWQHRQYNYHNIHWNIWSSNLGSSKRSISSPKHPHQLQHPPSIQLNKNHSFLSSSKVTSADSLTTNICLGISLKISGAMPPLNLSVYMEHIGINLFYPHLLCTYLSTGHMLSGLIKNLSTHYLLLKCTLHQSFVLYSLIQLH